MIGQLVKISDLKLDDEIIISSYSQLKYLKVLVPVQRKLRRDYYNNIVYKRLKCSIRQDNIGTTFKQYKYIFETDINKHNKQIYLDLQDRDIYLVKRKE